MMDFIVLMLPKADYDMIMLKSRFRFTSKVSILLLFSPYLYNNFALPVTAKIKKNKKMYVN